MKRRRRRGGFGLDVGPRWTQVRDTADVGVFERSEPDVGRCGAISINIGCSKRPGKPVFGKPYSCMGRITHRDPHTEVPTGTDLRRIHARTWEVAVESALLDADEQVERLRSKCYRPHDKYDPKYPGWSPRPERWRWEDDE
jgi:hypothetical protein